MVAAKPGQNGSTYISAHRPVRNAISTAKPMVWGFPNSMEPNALENPTWQPPKRKYNHFSVLAAARVDFPLPMQSYRIAFGSIELGNPENIGFAVETAFLTGLRAEI